MDNLFNSICPGDILIFKAGDDWIGKSIAWLTRSDVSHAAMMYGSDTIVEMGLSGIMVNKIAENPEGKLAHILRLAPEMDSQPLLDAASVYVNSQVKYDLPSLVLLAGLLIYRQIRPTPKLKIITDTILRLACVEIDKLIMLLRKDKKHTMVCSQLVYQCYQDCPKDYHIRIQDGDLQASNDAIQADSQTIRLIDQLDRMECNNLITFTQSDLPKLTPDEAAKELYLALLDEKETHEIENELTSANSMDDILQIAKQLLLKLEAFLEEYGLDLPVQALFITPGDLLNHSVNLTNLGSLMIERCPD